MPDPALLETLVRAADGPAGIRPLLRALGLAGTPPGDVACAGFPETPEASAATVVADSGGLRSLLVELRSPARPPLVGRLSRRLQQRDPLHPHLLIAADPAYARLTFAAAGLDGEVRQATIDRRRPRRSELETLAELAAADGEGGTALALRHARALERSRVTRRFFRDFRGRRDAVAAAWRGLPPELDDQRQALALLFLSRLMFLYFLQREGHLAGNPEYLPRLVRAPASGGASIYRARLEPLFFGALNRRPEQRDDAARALGALPYLNGGLFERHPLERRAPALDLPDDVVLSAFDLLLDRYRFTTREPAGGLAAEGAGADADEGGVDPEMLGRVFEGLMAPEQRGATGSFYTPAPVVERLTREAVAAYVSGPGAVTPEEATALLRGHLPSSLDRPRAAATAARLASARVLDPACGSGAFLLGALGAIGRARLALAGGDARALRRDVVARALHGVDLQADAALLCALRLWLALAERPGGADAATVPPLPNLDLRIRQGDALLDPMDLLSAPGRGGAPPDRAVRAAVARIRPLAERYLGAEPGEKDAIRAELRAAEAALAEAWLAAAARRLGLELRELTAAGRELDLFGERTAAALDAERARPAGERALGEAEALRARLRDEGALPFFSFAVHFAEALERGFDLVLSNPPWLRAHRWPASVHGLVRRRYEVCRSAGWGRATALGGAPPAAGGQVDLALLFLERSLALLAPGGVLGMLLPAKTIRSLYGAGGRRLLLLRARLVSIEDHSLDQHSLFHADAFAAAIVAERTEAGGDAVAAPPPARRRNAAATTSPTAPVRVTMVRRRVPPLRFAVPAHELPLVPGDAEAPWLLAPPEARLALRRMQRCPPLGEDPALRVRRGVFTDANDCLLVARAEAKLSGLARIRAEGAARRAGAGATGSAPVERFEAIVEARGLAPVVRGSGIGAWRFDAPEQLVWVHDDVTGAPRPAPPRLARYLERHAAALERRRGVRPGAPPGSLLRVTADTLRPKLGWQDLAATLEAVALPARIPGLGGELRPLVPLNTVYFIALPSSPEVLLLAAYLNSLPVRTFARAIAERAKDARFRFFAWVVALLPLPAGWRSGQAARRLVAISKEAHAARGITPEAQAELDAMVARAYGLSGDDVAALAVFDRWLRGVP